MKKPNAFGRFFGFKKSYFGSDTAGHDVKAFGDTTGKYMEWDASTNKLIVSGALALDNIGLTVKDTGGNHITTIKQNSDEAANRIVNIPALGADDTFAMLGQANAFTARQTTTDGVVGGTALVIGGRANSFTANGAALTNSIAETVLASYTIPANTLKAGSKLSVKAMISVTADAGATTLTPRLRLGPVTLVGTVLVAGTATDTAANHVFVVEFDLIAQAAPGAAAACRGWGRYQDLAAAGGAFKSAVLGTGGVGANFATNGALLLELTGQWSVADANSCLCTFFDVHAE